MCGAHPTYHIFLKPLCQGARKQTTWLHSNNQLHPSKAKQERRYKREAALLISSSSAQIFTTLNEEKRNYQSFLSSELF